MPRRKSTDELLKIIAQEEHLDNYFLENAAEFDQLSLPEFLEALLTAHGISKSDAITRSGLDRVYAYQIFSGMKHPGRDKLLALCLAARATLKETQHVLRLGGWNMLHPRNVRDSVVIHAITHEKSVDEINEILYDMGLEMLQ